MSERHRLLDAPLRDLHVLVYEYLEAEDRLVVLAIQDARSSSEATSG